MIGDYLTEINVTSPTGIREVKRFGGRHRGAGLGRDRGAAVKEARSGEAATGTREEARSATGATGTKEEARGAMGATGMKKSDPTAG